MSNNMEVFFLKNDEKILDYFWDVLKRTETIKNSLQSENISDTPETQYLKGIAFAELLRHNVKFKLIQPDKEITKTKSIGFLQVTSVTQNDDTREACIIITNPEGVEYSCELDLIKKILNTDYNRVVLKISDDGKSIPTITELNIPDLPEEAETKETSEEKGEEKGKDEASSIAEYSAERLPEFMHDGRYKDDPINKKQLNTFICKQHDLEINSKLGNGIIHFYVYPLGIKANEKATDIFVVAESGGVCRTSISRGKTSSLEIEFEGISFAVRGSFENGDFISMVKPLAEELVGNYVENIISYDAKIRTSSTYMQTEIHGILFNVFPAQFGKNKQNGLCPAGIVIERNNQLEIFTPTSEGSFVIKGNEGETISLITYWTGGDNPQFRIEEE